MDKKENAFKYKHNLWQVTFKNGATGLMVAETKEKLEKFYKSKLGPDKVKNIKPMLFGVVE